MKPTVVIATCLLVASLAKGGGKEVLVAVGRTGAVKGELVEVRDSTLVVAVHNDDEELRVVPIRDIQWVSIKGENFVPTSAVLGMLLGGVIGATVGASTVDKSSDGFGFKTAAEGALGGVVGAGVGLAIGYGIGSGASSKKITVTPEDGTFRQVLNSAARNRM
jgi:hypothetical protein